MIDGVLDQGLHGDLDDLGVERVRRDVPGDVDGLSMLPTLLGEFADQDPHEYLYWEFQGRQAVRLGDWKGYRSSADSAIELYDLGSDIGEQRDVADRHADVVARIADIMVSGRTESDLFPLVREK